MWAQMFVHCSVDDDVDSYVDGDGVAVDGCAC